MDQNEALQAEVGITLGKLLKQLGQAEARTVKTAKRMEAQFNRETAKSAQHFKRIDNQVQKSSVNLNRFGGVLAGALSIRQVQGYADAWTVAENKIAAASQVAGRAGRNLSEINDIADRTRSGISETADLYAKLLRATAGVAKSEEDVARATETVNKAFKAGGAAASEQAAGILQLAQGLSSGVLQGDELRSIRENAPLVAQAIADEFGVTIGQLKELGAEGKLTSDRVFQAILSAQPQIEAAFAQTNATVGEGFTRLRNAITEYIGGADQSVGATAKIGAALAFLATNLDLVAASAALVVARFAGSALSALFAATASRAALASTAMVGLSTGGKLAAGSMAALRGTMALLGGPFGVVIAALSVLPFLMTSSSERIDRLSAAGNDAVKAMDDYAAASKRAAGEQDELAGKVSAATLQILNQSRAAAQESLRLLRDEYEDFMGAILDGARNGEVSQFATLLDQASGNIGVGAFDGGANAIMTELADSLRDVGRGEGDIAAVTAQMEYLSGVGEEVTGVIDRFNLAIENPAEVDLSGAIAEMVKMAETIGGFDDELSAIDNAGTLFSQARAAQDLAARLHESAQAGEVLREHGGTALREMLENARDAGAAIKATELFLQGNVEEALKVAKAAGLGAAAAEDIADGASQIDFGGAAATAANLADQLERAVGAAIDLRSQGIADLDRARIDNEFRTDPIGRAAALARAQFDARTSDSAGADSTVTGVIEAERRAYVAAAVAAEEYRQATIAANQADSEASRSGAGGSDEKVDPLFTDVAGQIESLKQQIEFIGLTNGEIAKLKAQTELLNEAKKRGLDLDARNAETGRSLREEIDAQAAAVGRLTEQQESLNARTGFWNQQMSSVRSGLVDAIIEGENFEGVLANVAKAIAKAALQAALFNDGPLKDIFGAGGGLFSGGGGGGSGGGLGGMLAGLLGFEGGGYTGNGSRTGGVDGRGGFPAILHPNETVIDHTKSRQSSGPQSLNVNVNVTGANGDKHIIALVGQGVSQGMSQIRREVPGIVVQHQKRSG